MEVTRIDLGHRQTISRSKRSILDGYDILKDNIDPDQTQVTVDGDFDLTVTNEFMLFAYEDGVTEPTANSGSEAIVIMPTTQGDTIL